MRSALSLAVLACTALAAAVPRSTFDIATYGAPEGWKSQAGSDAVVYVKGLGPTACLVSILKSHDAVAADFAGEYAPSWKTILQLMGATPVPPPASPVGAKSGDVAFLSGSALTTLNGKPVVVMMFLLDAGAKVMPVVAVASTAETLHKICILGIKPILDGIALQKTPRGAGRGAGQLNVPAPPPLTVADFAGEWHRDDHAVTSYASSATGAYAGSLATISGESFTADAKGQLEYRFVGMANGKEVRESDTGTLAISGTSLELRYKRKGTTKLVVTGWLDGDTVTILRVLPARVEPTEANVRDSAQYWARAKKK